MKNLKEEILRRKNEAVAELEEYGVSKKEIRQCRKYYNERLSKVEAAEKCTYEITEIKIIVEWKKSRKWGSNPHAEVKAYGDNYFECFMGKASGSGCGYDKESTAIANALNQLIPLKKAMYAVKDKDVKKTNQEVLGYGSGYGVLPYFEGGVGIQRHCNIFERLGYTFRTVASGKTFAVYEIVKRA